MKRVVVVTLVEDIPLVGTDVPEVDRWILPRWLYNLLNFLLSNEEKLERTYE
jgi:hypothetical protein